MCIRDSFHNLPEKEIQPAPHIGEHTEAVLKELGIDPEVQEGAEK